MFSSQRLLAAAFIGCLAVSPYASATPVTTDGTYYEFAFGAAGTEAFACTAACAPAVNPASIFAPDPPWTFDGPASLFVLDLFLSVDRFEIFNNAVSLGQTSAPTPGGDCGGDIQCAILNSAFSQGTFELGPGSHSITILHTLGQTGAAVFSVTSTIPEPSTFGLLFAGLGGLMFAYRKRQTTVSK